jgi:hypothetical protein
MFTIKDRDFEYSDQEFAMDNKVIDFSQGSKIL